MAVTMTERGKRDFLFVACELGHDMKHIGGCNAGCHELCSCSVPVHECTRCGDCDYGDNAEATMIRADCANLYGDPVERFSDRGDGDMRQPRHDGEDMCPPQNPDT